MLGDGEPAGVSLESVEKELVMAAGELRLAEDGREFADAHEGVGADGAELDAGLKRGDEVIERGLLAEVEAEGGFAEDEVEVASGGGGGDSWCLSGKGGEGAGALVGGDGPVKLDEGEFDQRLAGQRVGGMLGEELLVMGNRGGGIRRVAMKMLEAGAEVAGVDADLVGGIFGQKRVEQGGGLADAGVGFGLELEKREGLAEAGIAVRLKRGSSRGKDVVGIGEEAGGGELPGIRGRF